MPLFCYIPFLYAAFFSPRPAALHCPLLSLSPPRSCRRRLIPLRLPLPQLLLLPRRREFPRQLPKHPQMLPRSPLRTWPLSPSPMVEQMSRTMSSWRPPPAEAALPSPFCPSLELSASPRWLSRDDRTLRTPILTRILNHRTARSHRSLKMFFCKADEGIRSNIIEG